MAKRKALGTLAALGALGAIGAAASRGRSASNGPRKLVLSDSSGGREEVDPFYRDVAEDITSKPLMTRGKTAAQVAEMIKNPVGRESTDSEMRYIADMAEQLRGKKYARTAAGAPIFTADGDAVQFDSDQTPVASRSARYPTSPYGLYPQDTFKKGGKVSSAKIGKTASASRRGDGIVQRGKTRGKMV